MTVSRDGPRWHASVLARVTQDLPTRPTRRQQAAGRVGVDLGVKSALVLSDPLSLQAGQAPVLTVDNPRLLQNTARVGTSKAARGASGELCAFLFGKGVGAVA
ncbi:hypothetical protein ACH4SP_12420 [Streptomyces sp. NPDC021093]|uniref:hypothetical protein n=1 Tax=Streptomyces sp. NPDC021093 TaxID=3365112 RepID=UPI003788913E